MQLLFVTATVTPCNDNGRSWFSLRQTRGQPSYTVTHPLSSSRRHDSAAAIATAAHRYLKDLPWDKVKEMKESVICVFVCDYVHIIVSCGWSLKDGSEII